MQLTAKFEKMSGQVRELAFEIKKLNKFIIKTIIYNINNKIMKTMNVLEERKVYKKPELLDISFACLLPGAGVGPSEGEVEGENGLDAGNELNTDSEWL